MATFGFGLVIAVVFSVVQIVVVGIVGGILLQGKTDAETKVFLASIGTNGFVLSISAIATSVTCVGLIILFAAIRRGITVKQYLDFSAVRLNVLLRWVAAVVLLGLVFDGLSLLLDRPIVPEFVTSVYQTAEIYSLLWIAIVLAAPLLEELFFRGFLFEGLRGSKLGAIGAVIVTSVAWAAVHVQYGVFDIVMIAFLGLLLGVAKVRTGSIYTTIVMHVTANFVSMVEATVLAGSAV